MVKSLASKYFLFPKRNKRKSLTSITLQKVFVEICRCQNKQLVSKPGLFLGISSLFCIPGKRVPSIYTKCSLAESHFCSSQAAKSQLPNGGWLNLPSPAKSRSISDLQQKNVSENGQDR